MKTAIIFSILVMLLLVDVSQSGPVSGPVDRKTVKDANGVVSGVTEKWNDILDRVEAHEKKKGQH
uniref:Uncharacterized protein n=1 Tax=Arion vulgaris TaxID=1028688 RepID=A0A0B6YXA0_9EUPU